MPFSNGADYLTAYGAGVLVTTIEAYWKGRGFAGIRAEVFPIGSTGAYGVRSNVGPMGFPPRAV